MFGKRCPSGSHALHLLTVQLQSAAKEMYADDAKVDVAFCRRPTFFKSSKLRRLDKVELFKDPAKRSLADFVGTLADLAYPKAALSQLQEPTYMLALEDGIQAALAEQPGWLPQCGIFIPQQEYLTSVNATVGILADLSHQKAALTAAGCPIDAIL